MSRFNEAAAFAAEKFGRWKFSFDAWICFNEAAAFAAEKWHRPFERAPEDRDRFNEAAAFAAEKYGQSLARKWTPIWLQ